MTDETDSTDKSVARESSPCCMIHEHAACEVEVLESSSKAVIRVVECLAPAVVSITSRPPFRDNGRSFETEGGRLGGRDCTQRVHSHQQPRRSQRQGGERSFYGRVRALNLSTDQAVIVLQVVKGGPADEAGLQTGDLVIRIGDRDVATMDDVYRFLTEWPVGKPVIVTVLRLGQQLAIDVRRSEAAPDG